MNPADRDLISRFLDRVADLSQEEVEKSVPGITQSDMTRWRRDDWQRLTAKKRRAVERFLKQPKNGKSPQKALMEAARILEAKAKELRRQADSM